MDGDASRQASADELADSLIQVLVALLLDEPHTVAAMVAAGSSPWHMVEMWHVFNNCFPLRGLDQRLAVALGEASRPPHAAPSPEGGK